MTLPASAWPCRHRPPLGLLQRLLPGLPGHLHLVGLPLSHQPLGLQCNLRHGGLLWHRSSHLPLLLPDSLRPGHAPTYQHLGQVRARLHGPPPSPRPGPARLAPLPLRLAVGDVPSLGRVFGLKDFVSPTNCSSPHVLVLNTSHDWPVYVSPGILLLLCYTVTSLLKLRTHQPADEVSARGQRTCAAQPPPSGHDHARSGELSSRLWTLQRKEAAGADEEREVELTEVDQWPQGQTRAMASKEEGAVQVRSLG